MTANNHKPSPDRLNEQQYLELIESGDLTNREQLRLVVNYLAACVDTAEATNIELYEHYRRPVDQFRYGLRALARQLWWQEERYDIMDDVTRSQLAGAVLKACRLRLVLPEKYQRNGEHIRDYLGETKNEED